MRLAIPTAAQLICLLVLMVLTRTAHADLDGSFTGAWYDTDFDGAGFLVEVLPDGGAVVYWFTYDDAGNQNWYIGQGITTDDSIVINDLMITDGGVFGDAFDPDSIVLQTVGQLTLTFDDCNRGQLDFVVNGVSSIQQLSRLTAISGLGCTKAEPMSFASSDFDINQTGSWFDISRSGEGFIIQVLENQQVVIFWFTYDPSGNQAWFTGVGHATESFIHVEDLIFSSGGKFGPDHDPSEVVRTVWGSLELQLGCKGGEAHYDLNDPEWGQGQQQMSRLSDIKNLECHEQNFVDANEQQLIGLWESEGFGYAARIEADGFLLFQYTGSSCLLTAQGPVGLLLEVADSLQVNQDLDRIRLDGLDAVSPIDFASVSQLPTLCDGTGSSFTSDPNHNFSVFSDTLAERYAAFEVRGVDWSAQVSANRDRINSTSTPEELFTVFSDMLAPLMDSHVTLTADNSVYQPPLDEEISTLFNRSQRPEIDKIISEAYLGGTERFAAANALRYGTVNPSTGYLEVSRMQDFVPDGSEDENLAFLQQELDQVFGYFAEQNIAGLIIDVRRNEGGNLTFGLEIAGRMSRGIARLAFSERRRTADDLTAAIASMVRPTGGVTFDGNLALLTSRLTASAAESFVFAVKAFPHATVIGERTRGALSRTERILPNGWVVSITAGQVEAPNGDRYEAIGIPFDIETAIFTDSDLVNSRDAAIDAAIGWLQSQDADNP